MLKFHKMSTSLEIQTRNSTTSLSSNETPSDDFVLVSPSNSLQQFSSNGSKPCQASIEGNSSKKFAGESHREDEIIQKVVELGHENDQLKDALQKNNVVLQVGISIFFTANTLFYSTCFLNSSLASMLYIL